MKYRRNSKNSGDFSPWLLIVSVGLTFFSASGIAQQHDVIIEGQSIQLNTISIKCEVGEIENVSTKRLLNCDSAELVKIPSRKGHPKAVKFTITPYDDEISDGVRAELRDMHVAKNGDVVWYRFSSLLPKDFPIDADHRLVLSQWHEKTQEGVDSLRPPLSHRLWNGRFVITLWNNERVTAQGVNGDGRILYETDSFSLGEFHEFIYKVRWSGDDDGEVLAWKRECPILDNGCSQGSGWRNIIRYTGSTGYRDDEVKGYYFKLGLYTVTPFDVTFNAFHMNYRTASTSVGIDATDAIFQ